MMRHDIPHAYVAESPSSSARAPTTPWRVPWLVLLLILVVSDGLKALSQVNHLLELPASYFHDAARTESLRNQICDLGLYGAGAAAGGLALVSRFEQQLAGFVLWTIVVMLVKILRACCFLVGWLIPFEASASLLPFVAANCLVVLGCAAVVVVLVRRYVRIVP